MTSLLFRKPDLSSWNEELYSAGRGFWGALTTWEDSKGTRWIYAPTHGVPIASKGSRISHEEWSRPRRNVDGFQGRRERRQASLNARMDFTQHMNIPGACNCSQRSDRISFQAAKTLSKPIARGG